MVLLAFKKKKKKRKNYGKAVVCLSFSPDRSNRAGEQNVKRILFFATQFIMDPQKACPLWSNEEMAV